MNNFKNFSNIIAINESKHITNIDVMSKEDLEDYIVKTNKKIPKIIGDILYLTKKYELLDQKSIDDIKNANKSQLDKLAFNYNIPELEIQELWKSLKDLKTNIRLLPQYQTPSERKAFMSGKIKMEDITIDTETSAGRNALTKQYSKLLYFIVNQFVGQSNLDKAELISAAQIGFVYALNEWRKNKESSDIPFKTYAAHRIKQEIIRDIQKYSHSLSGTNWYAEKHKGDVIDAVSLDGFQDENGEFKQDYFSALGEDPKDIFKPDEEEQWKQLYSIIDSMLNQRDADIFYRYFGLNGRKKETYKDISKSLGVSGKSGRVKYIIDQALKHLVKNKNAYEILQCLQTAYNESLFIEINGMDKKMIVEYLLNDDMFMLLEELTKWINKDQFKHKLQPIFKSLGNESDIIKKLLSGDFDNLDSNFKSNKKIIIKFLTLVYPTENISRKTDVALLEYMDELSYFYKKHFNS